MVATLTMHIMPAASSAARTRFRFQSLQPIAMADSVRSQAAVITSYCERDLRLSMRHPQTAAAFVR